jgi:hypothetical protein
MTEAAADGSSEGLLRRTPLAAVSRDCCILALARPTWDWRVLYVAVKVVFIICLVESAVRDLTLPSTGLAVKFR